jgi:hypothetical protein
VTPRRDRWQAGNVYRERLRALSSRATAFMMPGITGRFGWRGLVTRASSSPASSGTVMCHGGERSMVGSGEERDRWEHVAPARDAEKWSTRVATDVAKPAAAPQKLHEESPATPWEREASDDTSGGTRLRDLGIMKP